MWEINYFGFYPSIDIWKRSENVSKVLGEVFGQEGCRGAWSIEDGGFANFVDEKPYEIRKDGIKGYQNGRR